MKSVIKKYIVIFRILPVIVLLGLLNPVVAWEGPAQVIPGGYDMDDSDPGDGEQWGRSGGRMFTFSNFLLDELTQLLWGVSGANAVIITFDGNADQEGENNLSYIIYSAQGYIEWTGQTQVELFSGNGSDGMFPVDTKLRLTIRDHDDNPVSFINNPINGLPQVDVYNLPPPPYGEMFFSATLEVLAKNPSAVHTEAVPGIEPTPEGEFGPALDVFDCLRTDPNQTNEAITSFNWGFFFERAEAAMTVEEHDEHLTDLFDVLDPKVSSIATYAQFFFEDWPLKFNQTFENQGVIQSDIGNAVLALQQNGERLISLEGSMLQLPQKMDDLSLKIDNLPFNDITSRMENLPNINLMLLLFGIEGMTPPDPDLPPFQIVKDNSFLYQSLTGIDGKADQLVNDIGTVHLDLGSKIGTVDGKVDGVTSAVNSLNTGITGAVSAVNDKVVSVGERVDGLHVKVDLIQDDMGTVQSDLGNKITTVDGKVDGIASAVNSINTGITGAVSAVNDEVVSVGERVDGLHAKVDLIQDDMGTAQSDLGNKITTVDGKVDGVTLAVNSLNIGITGAVSAVNDEVVSVGERIDELQTKVDFIQTELADKQPAEIKLEIINRDKNPKKEELNLLVLLKEKGKAANATLTSIQGIMETENGFEKITLQFELVAIDDGVVACNITLDKDQPPETIVLSAVHEIAEDVTIFGTCIFPVD